MDHEIFMKRCIELAQNGLGTTYPNPIVGSVVVHNGTIIGEGWHRKSGEAHAEVNAVNSVKKRELLKFSTIYVSLEPCSHFGKTPPCCDLIIANGIPNIVIGTVDPNSKVAGNGIKKLIEAGRNVTIGILEDECVQMNRRFFTFQEKKRPYVILKWAESADGFIAPLSKNEQKPVWISNQYSRQLVHKWRSEEHAILVGTQTVIDDNPKLDVRDWTGNNSIRVVIDKNLRITKESHIFDNQVKTIIITAQDNSHNSENTIYGQTHFGENLPEEIIGILYKNDIQSVIIEGGSKTLQSFIDSGIWDEARVFKSAVLLGNGIAAPVLKSASHSKKNIHGDELLNFWNND